MKIIFIWFIELYQKFSLKSGLRKCKFYPTCSEYTKHAISKYGAFKGTFLGIYRILRCNPFSRGGYDPLK